MEELKLLEELFDHKVINLLRLFFAQPSKQFYLTELSELSKVSIATTHRIVSKFVRMGLVQEIKIAKFKIYQYAENEKTEFLGSFMKQSVKVLEIFVDMISTLEQVKMVILHGEESENKANLLVIGRDIDNEKVKMVANEVREKHNFLVTYLILDRDQYMQMHDMGLYSGKKKILMER